MFKVFVLLVVLPQVALSAECACGCTIYDKETGTTYLTSEIVDLIKELRKKLANCAANGGNIGDKECQVQAPNKSWFTDNCSKKNVCVDSKLYSEANKCPANSFCGKEDGYDACLCNTGFQWDTNKKNCIAVTEKPKNACVDADGTVYVPNKSVLLNNCQQLKMCFNNKLYTQDYECPANSFCGKERGYAACVCNAGFRWDANKKNCIAVLPPVPQQPNSCVDADGTVYVPNVSFIVNNCQQTKACIDNELYTQDYNCPANSFCGKENGYAACVCNTGFKWDKHNCISNQPTAEKPKNACVDADGTVYVPNKSVLLNNCQQLKMCFNNKLYAQNYECPANSFCGKEDGFDACVCNAGFQWDANKKNCIPQQPNSCVDADGTVYVPNMSFLVNNCQQMKACINNKLYTQDYDCPENSVCGKEDGYATCVCNTGFKWDTKKHNCI